MQQQNVKEYFSKEGTVSQWWDPEGDRNGYHYRTEKLILKQQLVFDPDWRVLDVGCGQGRYTIWFAQRGSRVTAVDISQEMLTLCRQNAEGAGVSDRIELVLADAEGPGPLEDELFDVVSCMGTFVHLPNLQQATTEMVKRLRPGGRLLFSFASAESLHGRLVSGYFSSPRLRRVLGKGEDFAQVARPLFLDDTIRVLENAGLSQIKVFGIGLLFLFVRPEFGNRIAVRLLRSLSVAEERLQPYYSSRRLVRLSATVLGIGTRTDKEQTT